MLELFCTHDVALGVYGIIIIILSKANKKKENEGRARGASGSKSAESSPSTLKKEQSATAADKKVCFYAIIVGSMPMHASVIQDFFLYRVPATVNCRGLHPFARGSSAV